MCGIAGIFERSGRGVDRAILEAMTVGLAHRGPDGQGIWTEGGIGLGHRRLAIRDLTANGDQPFHSANGDIVVSFNGEIYNDAQLAAELGALNGFRRRTRSDTEILPEAWLAWGPAMFERLEGIFAIAIWDRSRRELVLARDRMGVKPLYYRIDEGRLAFASEPKAFLTDRRRRSRISAPDLADLLASGYTAPGASLVEGVRQIAPGSYLTCTTRTLEEVQYWSPARAGTHADADGAAERFLDLFAVVVGDQLVSDVPVAIMQSGGIDSTLVSVSLPRQADARLYSVGFDERDFDESALAAEAAALSGRELTTISFGRSDTEADFKAVAVAVDGALADSSALATYRLCRAIAGRAKVALSGDGGDELFAGYPTYRASRIAGAMGRVLPRGAWRSAASALLSRSRPDSRRMSHAELAGRMLHGLGAAVPHTAWRHYLAEYDRAALYGRELAAFLDAEAHSGYREAFERGQGSVWDRSLLADQAYYLPADMLVKLDRTSMAHGLEVRVPYLDSRIVAFSSSMHTSALADMRGRSKIVLRRAVQRAGASRRLAKARKRGFNVPITELLRTDLARLADRIFERDCDVFSGYIDPDGARRMWREHKNARVDRKYVLWTLLTFATWREATGI